MLDVLPLEVPVLRADGGATANRFLMQLQTDLIGCPVEVARTPTQRRWGGRARWARGRHLGGPGGAASHVHRGARYEPRMAQDEVAQRRADWQDAVRRVLV